MTNGTTQIKKNMLSYTCSIGQRQEDELLLTLLLEPAGTPPYLPVFLLNHFYAGDQISIRCPSGSKR